jgi:hypothetical protein
VWWFAITCLTTRPTNQIPATRFSPWGPALPLGTGRMAMPGPLLIRVAGMEYPTGLEPAHSLWKSETLPLRHGYSMATPPMAKTGTTKNRRLVIFECPNHRTDDQGMIALPKKCLWSVGAGERSRTPIKCLQNTRSCPLSYTGIPHVGFEPTQSQLRRLLRFHYANGAYVMCSCGTSQ